MSLIPQLHSEAIETHAGTAHTFRVEGIVVELSTFTWVLSVPGTPIAPVISGTVVHVDTFFHDIWCFVFSATASTAHLKRLEFFSFVETAPLGMLSIFSATIAPFVSEDCAIFGGVIVVADSINDSVVVA